MQIIQPVRGTNDLLPVDKAKHNHVIDCAQKTAYQFGYQDMATPIFEFSEVFSRPLGAASDVVQKETYSFADRGGASLTLRPEGTAATMRAVLSNGLTQSLPLRWFYSGAMFRYERPQKGRMRQFHQIGCEYIGTDSFLADAEIISCAVHILTRLNILSETTLHINSLGDISSRDAYRAALIAYLTDYKQQLSQDSQRRLATNPLRILDSKSEQDQAIIKSAPMIHEYLSSSAKQHFDSVVMVLDEAKINWQFNPFLVRGLDYYSHTAFEFITDSLGAQGTVLGGGRYDGLCQMLGGPEIPAVGFAAGIERLALLATNIAEKPPYIALISADEPANVAAFALGHDLRAQSLDIVMLLSGNMNKKMKQANKMNCAFVIIIGSTELETQTAIIKDMVSGEQHKIALSQLANWLDSHPTDQNRSK